MTAPSPPPAAGEEARRLVDAIQSSAAAYGATGQGGGALDGDRRALLAYIAGLEAEAVQWRSAVSAAGHSFEIGDRVRKRSGSSWHGHVVGFYSTSLTPIGYAVESEREPGSVQIFPEGALEGDYRA